jgi:hypothetical protein
VKQNRVFRSLESVEHRLRFVAGHDADDNPDLSDTGNSADVCIARS